MDFLLLLAVILNPNFAKYKSPSAVLAAFCLMVGYKLAQSGFIQNQCSNRASQIFYPIHRDGPWESCLQIYWWGFAIGMAISS